MFIILPYNVCAIVQKSNPVRASFSSLNLSTSIYQKSVFKQALDGVQQSIFYSKKMLSCAAWGKLSLISEDLVGK